VKTIKFKSPRYIGDPINAVKIFNDKEVDELVFLDINATITGKQPNLKLLREIASECFMPLGYGGGITSIDVIKEIFNLGVEKVIINTQAFENPGLLSTAANLFGSQSIVASMDVKKNFWGKYEVYVMSGKKRTRMNPLEYAKKMESLGAGEIFLNSIDRDGTFQGYDTNLIKMVADSVKIPVIACGGASNIQDFADAINIGGVSAVSAGSMFVFQGKHRAVLITYPPNSELERIFKKDTKNEH
jgi:cyclase